MAVARGTSALGLIVQWLTVMVFRDQLDLVGIEEHRSA
jgi:hypothetical protein